jgi:ABC-2 type transport system permease protein
LRRVDAVNLGDLVFGVGLFAIAGSPTPQRTLLFVVASLAASVVFAGFLVVMGSLTFFAGKGEAGELGFHSIVMFAAYPVDVFTGFGKALLYTAVPAGFVAAAPASLVDDFDVSDAALLGMAAIVFAALAAATFTLGLRRYTGMSGRWTTR